MSRDVYKLTSSELERHWGSLEVLCRNVMIWPDPRDLLMTGSKLYVHHVTSLSAQALGLSIPNSVVYDNPTVGIVEDIINGEVDGVLKREYSSDSLHVYTKHTQNAVSRFKTAISEELKTWNLAGSEVFPSRPRWFIQPYLAPLIYLGEICAFITNGILVNVVVKTPQESFSDTLNTEACQAVLLRPLSNIRYNDFRISFILLN